MNFIAQNKELEMMNIYLKGLSKKLQENYNNKGKYLSLGKTPYILWAESAFAWGIFYVTRIKIIPFKIGIILLILGLVGFTVLAIDYLDILKDFKIPVISKKRFLKKNINNLKIILYGFNLDLNDVILNSKTLEIKFNKKSIAKLKPFKESLNK